MDFIASLLIYTHGLLTTLYLSSFYLVLKVKITLPGPSIFTMSTLPNFHPLSQDINKDTM
jgi:hypothetical protein